MTMNVPKIFTRLEDRFTAYHCSKTPLHYLKLLCSFYFTLIINSQLNIRSTVNETIVMKIVLGWVLDCLGYNEKDELEFKQEDAGSVRLLHQV